MRARKSPLRSGVFKLAMRPAGVSKASKRAQRKAKHEAGIAERRAAAEAAAAAVADLLDDLLCWDEDVACRNLDLNAVPVRTGPGDAPTCVCARGYYDEGVSGAALDCQHCMATAKCERPGVTLATMELDAGYWRSGERSTLHVNRATCFMQLHDLGFRGELRKTYQPSETMDSCMQK